MTIEQSFGIEFVFYLFFAAVMVERATEVTKPLLSALLVRVKGDAPKEATIMLAAAWGIVAAWGFGLDMALAIGAGSEYGIGLVFTGLVLSGGAATLNAFLYRLKPSLPAAPSVEVVPSPPSTTMAVVPFSTSPTDWRGG
jgi:hypothetical protein